MDIQELYIITEKMNDLKKQEDMKARELEEGLRQLAAIQKMIASIERDTAKIAGGYQSLERELMFAMAAYLQERSQEPQLTDDVLV